MAPPRLLGLLLAVSSAARGTSPPSSLGVGALFSLWRGETPRPAAAVNLLAFTMALAEINNKTDGLADELLPHSSLRYALRNARWVASCLTLTLLTSSKRYTPNSSSLAHPPALPPHITPLSRHLPSALSTLPPSPLLLLTISPPYILSFRPSPRIPSPPHLLPHRSSVRSAVVSSMYLSERAFSADATVVAFIGPDTSATAAQASLVAAFRSLPLISYSATSPELSDRAIYPSFLRTVASDREQVRGSPHIATRRIHVVTPLLTSLRRATP